MSAPSKENSAAQGRESRATFELTDGDLALIYVYAPRRAGTAPGESKRQATEPCQAIFDFAEDGTLLGVEVIARCPMSNAARLQWRTWIDDAVAH